MLDGSAKRWNGRAMSRGKFAQNPWAVGITKPDRNGVQIRKQ